MQLLLASNTIFTVTLSQESDGPLKVSSGQVNAALVSGELTLVSSQHLSNGSVKVSSGFKLVGSGRTSSYCHVRVSSRRCRGQTLSNVQSLSVGWLGCHSWRCVVGWRGLLVSDSSVP